MPGSRRDREDQRVAGPRLATAAGRAAYDGAVHLDARTHSYDLPRHNRLRQAGWVVIQVDARGLTRWPAICIDLALLLSQRST